MFCRKCGYELKDGAKFCPKCGTPVASGNAAPQALHEEEKNRTEVSVGYETDKEPLRRKKKGPVILLIILIFLLLLAGSFTAFWFLGGKPMITRFLDDTFGTHLSEQKDEKTEEEESEEIDEDDEDEDNSDAADPDETEESDESSDETVSYDTGDRDATAEALRQRSKEREEARNNPQNNREEPVTAQDETRKEDPSDNLVQEEPVEEIPEEPELDEKDEYIFPDSDTRYLTKSDLYGMTAEDCRLARNEIYARHGRKFQDEELQAYFDAKSWYHGTIEPGAFKESMLNEIEKQNCILITDYEKEKGYR